MMTLTMSCCPIHRQNRSCPIHRQNRSCRRCHPNQCQCQLNRYGELQLFGSDGGINQLEGVVNVPSDCQPVSSQTASARPRLEPSFVVRRPFPLPFPLGQNGRVSPRCPKNRPKWPSFPPVSLSAKMAEFPPVVPKKARPKWPSFPPVSQKKCLSNTESPKIVPKKSVRETLSVPRLSQQNKCPSNTECPNNYLLWLGGLSLGQF
jgi:hypothetical protein